MALVVDASAMYAMADAAESGHAAVDAVLTAEKEPVITTELAVAEADYLILDRLGPEAEAAFLEDLVEGTYIMECLDRPSLERARDLIARYRALRIGLADASLVVLAAEYGTRRILSFDERGFRAITPLDGGAFTILPADA
jgi:predicted nucleic acid-binding protein